MRIERFCNEEVDTNNGVWTKKGETKTLNQI